MKLTDRSQIKALARFKGRGFLATSLFLDTDKGRLSKKEIQVSLKNLLSDGRSRLDSLDAAREKKESLGRDLDRIGDFSNKSLSSLNSPGLAVFSCAGLGFWEVYELPHGPRNRLLFDGNFHLRPLSAILDRYHEICALILGRREARWYGIFADGIRELAQAKSDVPGKVRDGGFEGTEGKRIERHINTHLQEHFKKAAEITFGLSKRHPFDWLLIGSEDNHFGDIESHLHRYLRDKLKGRLRARVSDSPSKILKEVQEAEGRLKMEEEAETLGKLVGVLEKGGLACSGLKDTLRSLNGFEVQSLVVTHQFAKPGRICPAHKFLYIDEQKCPICQKRTEIVADIVDEAIESAYKRGCPVKHITPPSKLDRYGHIAAFLKYKA
jgi:peptide chain release factor subunit 1